MDDRGGGGDETRAMLCVALVGAKNRSAAPPPLSTRRIYDSQRSLRPTLFSTSQTGLGTSGGRVLIVMDVFRWRSIITPQLTAFPECLVFRLPALGDLCRAPTYRGPPRRGRVPPSAPMN